MSKKGKIVRIIVWSILFVVVFIVSALIRVQALGSAPMKLLKVDWNETVGTEYLNMQY